MPVDLSWMVGQKLAKIEKHDYAWSFVLSDGSIITAEGAWWRLMDKERIVVTHEDDGHIFGLPQPVSAIERVMNTVKGQQISAFTVTQTESDLLLYFSDGARIHFLNSSCGYESWQINHKSETIICMGGGGLTVFDEQKK